MLETWSFIWGFCFCDGVGVICTRNEWLKHISRSVFLENLKLVRIHLNFWCYLDLIFFSLVLFYTSGTRAVEHIELGLSPRQIPARNGQVRQTKLYCIIDLLNLVFFSFILSIKGPRIHNFKMTNSTDHIAKKYNSYKTTFYITRVIKEHCMCWWKEKQNLNKRKYT